MSRRPLVSLVALALIACGREATQPTVAWEARDLLLHLEGQEKPVSLSHPPPKVLLARAEDPGDEFTAVSFEMTRPPIGELSWDSDVRVVPQDTALVTWVHGDFFEGSFLRKQPGEATIEFTVVVPRTGRVVLGPYRATFVVRP